YTIELSDEEGHQWRFAKEFKINETKAKQFNQTSVDKDRSSIRETNIFYLLGLVIFILGILLGIRRRKRALTHTNKTEM
uniref:LPXTG cell wall anchor domain-containing protein n=1 Tax=Enterococcus faecalis TaxID=1351 RepID=UPI0030C7BD8D